VVQCLEAEPDRTANELFDRLRREHPGMFVAGQLGTLQRRVKDWQRLGARRPILADPLNRGVDADAAVDDSGSVDSALSSSRLGQGRNSRLRRACSPTSSFDAVPAGVRRRAPLLRPFQRGRPERPSQVAFPAALTGEAAACMRTAGSRRK